MKYKHIIWDWNGTILDDCWLCVEIINTMLAPRNLPLMDRERYRRIFGFPIFDYYTKLGFDFQTEPFEEVAVQFIDVYRERQFECSLHQGAVDVLGICQRHKLGQSVLSAMEKEMLEQMVMRYGVRDYFQELVGLDDHLANGKIENGRQHIKKLSLNPAEVLFIGDTEHDFEVAQALGTDVLLVLNGHHSQFRLAETRAQLLDSIAGLPAFLSLQ